MRNLLIRDLLSELNPGDRFKSRGNPEHIEWIGLNLPDITEEFMRINRLSESYFIRTMSTVFKTSRFELLLKRWVLEYLSKFFDILDGLAVSQSQSHTGLVLEDMPLNRFGVEKYNSKFKSLPRIIWKSQPGLPKKIFSILARPLAIFYDSLNNGVKIFGKRKRYKVMRESLWGLYDIGGHYFHDDFLIDGHTLKNEDILLYSRGNIADEGRSKAYNDAKKSPYAHFNLLSLSLGIGPLFSRIIPKYIIAGSCALFTEIPSAHFSLYWSIYLCFVNNALLHEKIFSHFEITSEMGHNFFTASHIAEAIVCQNYGTRYYLMHWSDISVTSAKPLLSFLGCDGFLSWGKAHIQGLKGDPRIFMLTGYVFKKFIKQTMSNRNKILSDMGIKARGKIVTFFDESSGGGCVMRDKDYVAFWETAFNLAKRETAHTILIKQKHSYEYHNLPSDLKKKFLDINDKMQKMPNVYILDSNRWCFVEAIGVSDIAVTQGMCSSSTIAIICGIEGLYFHRAKDNDHPFMDIFNDKIVFDDSDKLLSAINRIIEGKASPLRGIPEDILREYDAYDDDLGIDRFREILCAGGFR